nr:uncharacterized protein LOC129271305 [Lytechinus pictus]
MVMIACEGDMMLDSDDYTHSLSSLTVTDLGDLNFEASWDPLENYTGMYNLSIPGKKNLCSTNSTSCFLGGRLLEDEKCPFKGWLYVVLEAAGQETNFWFSDPTYRVGPPTIQSTGTYIDSTNITIVIRGGQTPLYYDDRELKCQGESWEGDKRPIFMGMREAKDGVNCSYNLTNDDGSKAKHDKKNFFKQLGGSDGKLSLFLHRLKPFSNYSIAIWCELNKRTSQSTVYNFTTKEDVPSSGPTIVKRSSSGLGCDNPDMRNITFTIQPPPEDDRHGILLYYDICYRAVSSNQDEKWNCEVLELPSPPPDFKEVTKENISRWDAYEVKVFANNSVGGRSSSVYQFEVLKAKQAESRPVNLTTTELKHGVWLLNWDHPWSVHTRDCIVYYEVSAEEKPLGTTNATSFLLDTRVTGPVYAATITPMIHNGSAPPFKGLQVSTEVMSSKTPRVLIIVLSVLLSIFILMLIGCAYLCVQHGPRWTQSFDISNNSVLKTAFAMGDVRPRIPETEEFDSIVGVPPPPPPFDDDDGEDGDDEMETVAFIETPPAGRAGGDAVPRPPIPDQSPPPSSEGSLSEECNPMVAMEMDEGEEPVSSASLSCRIDGGSREVVAGLLQRCGNSMDTSCSEDSFIEPPPRHPSPTDSGYVQSPPPVMQQTSYQTKPAGDDGYFRFDAFTNNPGTVLIGNGKHNPGDVDNNKNCNAMVMSSKPKYTDSGYVAGTCTPAPSSSMYPETTPFPDKLMMLKAIGKQPSFDSDDMATSGSLSPSDSETGDGVGSYTKLSHPNTPLSPRNNALPGDTVWDLEKDLISIQDLLHQLNDQVQHPGLSNVG